MMIMRIFIVTLFLLNPLCAPELLAHETRGSTPQNSPIKTKPFMKKNIGKTDRFIRLAIATSLFSLAWWWGSWIVLAIASFTLYEAVAGWCVLYQLMGKNSCPLE